MADFASSVLQILGLKEWKTENDKKTLDEADITKLKSFGFTDTFINAFSKSLADDFKDESEDDNQGEPAAPSVSAQAAIVNGLLAQQTAKLADAMQQIEAMEKTNTDNTEALKQKNEEINTLKGRIEAWVNCPNKHTLTKLWITRWPSTYKTRTSCADGKAKCSPWKAARTTCVPVPPCWQERASLCR